MGFPVPWFVCGGCTLDLFLGKPIRDRHDVDIGIFRDDAAMLLRYFTGAEFFHALSGGINCGLGWGLLYLPVHEIHFSFSSAPWEVLLNERRLDQCVYRRNPSAVMPNK